MTDAEQLAQKRLAFAELPPGLAELELAVVKSEPMAVSVARLAAVLDLELAVAVVALAATVHMDFARVAAVAGSEFAVLAAASVAGERKVTGAVAAVQVGIPSVAVVAA